VGRNLERGVVDLISETYEDQRQTASDRYEDSGFELSQNIVNDRANVVTPYEFPVLGSARDPTPIPP